MKITADSFTFSLSLFPLILSPLLPFVSFFHLTSDQNSEGAIECFPLHKLSIREFAGRAALMQ